MHLCVFSHSLKANGRNSVENHPKTSTQYTQLDKHTVPNIPVMFLSLLETFENVQMVGQAI